MIVKAKSLAIIPFQDEEEAIQIANDTDYGLAAYVFSGDVERARRVALAIDAGAIGVNGAVHGHGFRRS